MAKPNNTNKSILIAWPFLYKRLWNFLRKKVVNTGFYRTKGKFRQAIKDFFDYIENYKEELEALITLNFCLYNSKTVFFDINQHAFD